MRVDSPVLLREATLADAPLIAELHAAACRVAYRDLFEPVFLDRLVRQWSSGWPKVFLDPEFVHQSVVLAESGDRPSAFAHVGPSRDDDRFDVEIYDCYSHPSSWGTGVADNLLDGVWDLLSGSPGDIVHLWTLAGANRARRFYERWGFDETGRTREVDFGDRRPVLEVEYAAAVP